MTEQKKLTWRKGGLKKKGKKRETNAWVLFMGRGTIEAQSQLRACVLELSPRVF